MNNFLSYLFGQPSFSTIQIALTFLRIGIGLLTIPHGYPKLFGGISEWTTLGQTFMSPLGITFLPALWGFLGGCTEFFGGIALALGLGTRIASFALIIMMIIAAVWHINRGDSFNLYSFPLSLIIVFITLMITGSGIYSIDYYLLHK